MRRFGGIGVAWFVATVVAVTIAAAAVGSVRSEVTDVPTALGVSVSPEIPVVTTDQLPNASEDGPDLAPTPTSTPEPVVETVTSEAPATETTTTTQPPTTTRPPAVEPVEDTDGGAQQEEAVEPRHHEDSSTSTPSTSSSEPDTTTTTRPATTVTTTTPATTVTTTTPATTVTTTTPATTVTTTTTTIPVSTAYTRIIDTEGGTLSVRVDGDDVEFRRAFPNSGWRFALGNPGPEIVEARFGSIDDRAARIKVLVTVIDGVLDVSVTSSS